MSFRIPLARPELTAADRSAVDRVLAGAVLSRGPALAEFERVFREWTGARYAVGLSSGTAALQLALHGAGVGPGTRVVTAPFSVPASVNPSLLLGAELCWVDIERESRALDPDRVEAMLRPGDVVLAVHPFGQPAPVDRLAGACAAHGAVLIEDACEALGTRIAGRHAGRFGWAGTFGFYPNKQLTTGEGGMLITDDRELAQATARLANHGRAMDGRWLDQVAVGYNFRLAEPAAALGLSQMGRLPRTLARRAAIAARYRDRLGAIAGLRLPPLGAEIGWFAYVLELPAAAGRRDRDELVQRMATEGIQCGRYFAPLHLQPGLAHLGCRAGDFPVTEAVAERALALPLYTGLEDAEVDEVAATLARLWDRLF